MSGLPDTYLESFHKDPDRYIRKLRYTELGNTGLKLSNISLGGSFLGKFYGDYDKSEAIQVIQECVKSGINYIDTSPWYGNSEVVLGEALAEVPRSTYFIGTKVGRNFTPTWKDRFDFSRSAVLKNVEQSLERLKLPYVDVIQVHDVEFADDPKQIINETLPALESVVKAGKAKFIGITAYDLNAMKNIVDKFQGEDCGISSILSYCRYNLNDTALNDYLPYFKSKNVGVINASPVSMGLLTQSGPPDWHPASAEIKKMARSAAQLAASKEKRLEEVSLAYSLHPKDQESITTTLVSISTKEHLEENLKIASTPISEQDQELIGQIRDVFQGKDWNWEGEEIEEYRTETGRR